MLTIERVIEHFVDSRSLFAVRFVLRVLLRFPFPEVFRRFKIGATGPIAICGRAGGPRLQGKKSWRPGGAAGNVAAVVAQCSVGNLVCLGRVELPQSCCDTSI
jgi:hypothetical protein